MGMGLAHHPTWILEEPNLLILHHMNGFPFHDVSHPPGDVVPNRPMVADAGGEETEQIHESIVFGERGFVDMDAGVIPERKEPSVNLPDLPALSLDRVVDAQ